MTFVAAERSLIPTNFTELTSLQFIQASTFEVSATPVSSPSLFEFLFTQQLNSSVSTSTSEINASQRTNDSEIVVNNSAAGFQTERSQTSKGRDDVVGINPLLNPLLANDSVAPATDTPLSLFRTSALLPSSSELPTTDRYSTATSRGLNVNSDVVAENRCSSTSEPEKSESNDHHFLESSGFTDIFDHQSAFHACPAALPNVVISQSTETSTSDNKNPRSTTALIQPANCGEEIQEPATDFSSQLRGSTILGVKPAIDAVVSKKLVGYATRISKQYDNSTNMTTTTSAKISLVEENQINRDQTLSDQLSTKIIEQLETESNAGLTSIEIQFEQAELGMITLFLSLKNNRVSIRVVTQKLSTRRIIESQMKNVCQKLSDRGVTCGLFEVDCHSDQEQASEPQKTVQKMTSNSSRQAGTRTTLSCPELSNEFLNVVA